MMLNVVFPILMICISKIPGGHGKELLTIKQALFRVLEGLEIATLVEGILAVFFVIIVCTLVMKTYEASQENLKILQRLASQDSRVRRRSNY